MDRRRLAASALAALALAACGAFHESMVPIGDVATTADAAAAHRLVVRGAVGSIRLSPAADDRVAVTTADQVVTFDANGVVSTGPCPSGTRYLAAVGGSLALVTDSALMLADARGAVRSSTPLRGAPEWLASVGADRVAAALVAPNAPSEMWLFDRGGAVTTRLPIPHNTAPPTVDAAGSMLLASRGGELVAVGADGAERWRVTTHETLRPPAVALPRGGVAIATEGSALLILDDTP